MEAGADHGVEAGRGGGVLRWVWIVGVVLVLYVLSTGPVARLMEKGILPDQAGVVYKPIDWVLDLSPMVRRSFEWYIGTVWGVEIEG